MSQVISCPTCGSNWNFPGPFTGSIPCPNCQQPIPLAPGTNRRIVQRAPAPPPPPPPPPVIAPQPEISVEPSLGLNIRKSTRTTVRPFRESTSPLDLFDWKFEKYLTPWIVRITWMAVLAMAGLWVTLLSIGFLISLLPDQAIAEPVTPNFGQFEPSFSPSRSARMQPTVSPMLIGFVFRCVTVLTTIAATFLMLLWIRVILECSIVVFNIAKTLSSIDEKTVTPN